MLKNIEIIELVDLSRDVGRVLQINFVSIFFWLCAFVDACKACKSLSRSYSKVQPILRLQQRKVQVVLMHQRWGAWWTLHSDTLIVWSSWNLPGKHCLDDFWSLPEAERGTKKDGFGILLVKFRCLYLLMFKIFNVWYQSGYSASLCLRALKTTSFWLFYFFSFFHVFGIVMNQGCRPGFASAAPATAACSCFHQEGFTKTPRHRNRKPKNRNRKLHRGLQDSRSPGSHHRDSGECWGFRHATFQKCLSHRC